MTTWEKREKSKSSPEAFRFVRLVERSTSKKKDRNKTLSQALEWLLRNNLFLLILIENPNWLRADAVVLMMLISTALLHYCRWCKSPPTIERLLCVQQLKWKPMLLLLPLPSYIQMNLVNIKLDRLTGKERKNLLIGAAAAGSVSRYGVDWERDTQTK